MIEVSLSNLTYCRNNDIFDIHSFYEYSHGNKFLVNSYRNVTLNNGEYQNFKKIYKKLPQTNIFYIECCTTKTEKGLIYVNPSKITIKFQKEFTIVKHIKILSRKNNKNTIEIEDSIKCSWHRCYIGNIFIHHSYMLNNWKGKFKLRYCNEIVIRFKPTTNEFSFLTISYNGDNFLAHGCPTETFLGYNDDIKYITDKYVLEKGIKHSMQDQSYILIPIFPRKPNDTFFVCGTLKQPSQDDLHFGFKLKDDAYFFYYYLKEKSLDVLDPFCKNNDNMYHTFNYLHYNYKFEKIKMTEINASDELYYGSKTVGYNFKDFTDSNYDKKVDIIPVSPICSQYSKNYMPEWNFIIDDNVSINKLYLNVSYYLVNFNNETSYDRNISVKCGFDLNDKYYSKSIKFEVSRTHSKSNNQKSFIKYILFKHNDLSSFGEYFCQIGEKIPDIKVDKFQIKNFYFIPSQKRIFMLPDILFKINDKNNAYCNKKISNYASISSMELTDYVIKIGKFSNEIYDKEKFTISNDTVQYISKIVATNVKVNCIYKTIVNTYFTTIRNFEFYGFVTETTTKKPVYFRNNTKNQGSENYSTKDSKNYATETDALIEQNNFKSTLSNDDTLNESEILRIIVILLIIIVIYIFGLLIYLVKRKKRKKMKHKGTNSESLSL